MNTNSFLRAHDPYNPNGMSLKLSMDYNFTDKQNTLYNNKLT